MIDNVRGTVARMAAIQSTIAGGAARPTTGSTSVAGSPELTQRMFSELLAQAGRGAAVTGTDYSRFGNTTLTPATGPRAAGAPPGLEGYANGQIPPALLALIPGTNERAWAPAAAAFDQMRRDAAASGIDLPLEDAYRPYSDQVRLADELGLYSQGGLAAQPGTSEHGWGRALDLDVNNDSVTWLRQNAWKYGFVETVPREPWHWEYHG